MTKEADEDPVLVQQKEDQNVVDAENIELQTNQQAANQKMIRNAMKRPPFIRRPSMRKRSYSYSEGHNSGKRFKRGGGGPPQKSNKFLFGGNIRDPLNLNALSKDEIERGKSEGILQPKKFEGYSAMAGKRWKRNPEKNKFLLGGNFRDPLNLNSLSDEKIARIANAVTPQSSPIPTPKHRKPEYKIEVLIPPNISDPLNLMSFEEDSNPPSPDLLSPDLLRRRRSNFKKFENSENSKQKVRFRKRAKSMVDQVKGEQNWHDQAVNAAARAAALSNLRRREGAGVDKSDEKSAKMDRVSPSLSSEMAESEATKTSAEKSSNTEERFAALETSTKPKKSVTISVPKKSKKFEYGNYNRYYGYRNPGTQLFPGSIEDPRLYHFKPEWFFGKDVLDIGCNVGALTLEIGRRFAPKSLLGIDIDPDLIRIAKKFAENLRDYQVPPSSQPTPIASLSAAATPSRTQDAPSTSAKSKSSESVFPQSFPLIYGPLDPTAEVDVAVGERSATSTSATPRPQQTPRTSVNSGGPMNLFGRKVRFLCDNYVLESDDLLELAQPEFDAILCLSTTKWIHLNFGDEGIKRAFKRMYAQLRPGGILILEAQGYSSYYKKRKLTPRIHENFQSIQFMPDQFSDYLLQEVGFTTSQNVAVPKHTSKGFQRPIQVFTKMPLLSSRSVGETSSSQNTPYYCASCGGGCGSSCPATPYSSHTTPYHSCSGSCQATPHYYHHYNTLGSEGETPVHSSMQ